jgi:hypothetical protein
MARKPISPLLAFQVRAEARAILFGAGLYPTADAAILPLMKDAWHDGLVDKYGTRTLMVIVDKAFAPFWEVP